LRASEERFRTAIGAVSDIIWTNNSEARWRASSPVGAHSLASAGSGGCVPFGPCRCSDPSEKIREWVGVHTDITERKQSETNLRASAARVRLATEATAVGIWEWNVLTNRVRWDAQMFTIYGIAPTPDGFLQYHDWSDAVLPEERARQEEILRETVRQRGHSQRKFRIRRRTDGEVLHIEAVETVRANADGEAEWVVGTNLDSTERKRGEESLRQAAEEIERASRAKMIFSPPSAMSCARRSRPC